MLGEAASREPRVCRGIAWDVSDSRRGPGCSLLDREEVTVSEGRGPTAQRGDGLESERSV